MRNIAKLTLFVLLAFGFCACQGTEQKEAAQTQAAATGGDAAKATSLQIIYFGSPG